MLLIIIQNHQKKIYKFFLQKILLSYRDKAKQLLLFFQVLPEIIINIYSYLKLYLFNLQKKNQYYKYLQEDNLFLKVIFLSHQRYDT
ncbi:MAG: hypothetical protein LN588_01930 [Rickettsia endosymbiont of Bryobia graminum]|nr:hypothetical protein [Rickettsia endosymbiont of Bryobia graminum]